MAPLGSIPIPAVEKPLKDGHDQWRQGPEIKLVSLRLAGRPGRGRHRPGRSATGTASGQDGLIVMLPRSELAEIVCGDAVALGTVTVLVPT